ncbi:uncharacterized protein A4U43_C05F4530 [Asparagus officinalis]|uniref:Uncharacterized protein n=1 Tax=Asparagus officinalis TaxID=4686 RepID=A0A5P1ERU5_ASPOF|nr:uncharacterized protein A4U43_C05F4530 [Asparagus officinalis]
MGNGSGSKWRTYEEAESGDPGEGSGDGGAGEGELPEVAHHHAGDDLDEIIFLRGIRRLVRERYKGSYIFDSYLISISMAPLDNPALMKFLYAILFRIALIASILIYCYLCCAEINHLAAFGLSSSEEFPTNPRLPPPRPIKFLRRGVPAGRGAPADAGFVGISFMLSA